MIRQKTLSKPIEAGGIGLHTGVEVNLRLVPAPPNTGYVFVRTDLDNFEIPANVEYISHCSYATTLMKKGSRDCPTGCNSQIHMPAAGKFETFVCLGKIS